MFFSKADNVFTALLHLQSIVRQLSVVDGLVCAHVDEFNVRCSDMEPPMKGNLFDSEHLGVRKRISEVLMEVFDVLDLTRLINSITLLLESLASIELHDITHTLEHTHEEEETTNYRTRPALTMVTVEHCYPVLVLAEKVSDLVADDEESVERWRFMVLPIKTNHILEYTLINRPSTNVHRNVFVLMLLLHKLSNGINRVPVQFLYPRSRKSHRDYPRRNVSQVQVVPVLLIPLLRTTHNFP